MTKKPGTPAARGPREQTAIRLDHDLIARLDAIAKHDEAETGNRPDRSDVLRGCLRLGIEARERKIRGK